MLESKAGTGEKQCGQACAPGVGAPQHKQNPAGRVGRSARHAPQSNSAVFPLTAPHSRHGPPALVMVSGSTVICDPARAPARGVRLFTTNSLSAWI